MDDKKDQEQNNSNNIKFDRDENMDKIDLSQDQQEEQNNTDYNTQDLLKEVENTSENPDKIKEELENPETKAEEKVAKGVSAIIYDHNGGYYFLILRRIKNWRGWEFCKGAVDDGETEQQALTREIVGETGIKRFKIIKDLGITRSFINPLKGNTVELKLFLVEANMNTPVSLSKTPDAEHDTYLWATEKNVLEKLTWENELDAFKKVVGILKS